MAPVATQWHGKLSCGTRVSVEVLESRPGLLPECAASPVSSIGIGARSPQRKSLMIMFPGNPGLVQWYEDFVRHLEVETDCLVLGFAGHSLHELNCGRHFVLQHQIDLADVFCRAVLHGDTVQRYSQCVVGGHSIGGYIALHMINRFPSVIRRAFLLTPTIFRMKVSPNGSSKDRWLNKPLIHAVCSVLLPLVHLMPDAVKDFVVRTTQRDMRERHRWIARGMTRPNILRNVLLLARSEFDEVDALDHHLIRPVEKDLVFYFVKKDGWVPLSDVATIQSQFPSATVLVEDDETVAHAWCLEHHHHVARSAVLPFLQQS